MVPWAGPVFLATRKHARAVATEQPLWAVTAWDALRGIERGELQARPGGQYESLCRSAAYRCPGHRVSTGVGVVEEAHEHGGRCDRQDLPPLPHCLTSAPRPRSQ